MVLFYNIYSLCLAFVINKRILYNETFPFKVRGNKNEFNEDNIIAVVVTEKYRVRNFKEIRGTVFVLKIGFSWETYWNLIADNYFIFYNAFSDMST